MSTSNRPALLVVGMQNDKASMMNKCLLKNNMPMFVTNTFVKAINVCIDTATEKGWPVIYAMDLHHSKHSSFLKMRETHCVLGSWGSVQVAGLRYALPSSEQLVRGLDIDGDSNDAYYVTDKRFPDLTKESRLREILTKNGSSSLFICGLSPDGCIEETYSTATVHGHDPIIISDCTILQPTTQTFSQILSKEMINK